MTAAQTGLFDEPNAAPTKAERKRLPDFWNMMARERGVPDGWQWYRLEVADTKAPRHQSASLVTGAVCTERFKSGKRKGDLNWAKRDKRTERTLVITFADFDAYMAAWERKTGVCIKCDGNGTRSVGWSSTEGHTLVHCSACDGTGAVASKFGNVTNLRTTTRLASAT